MAFILLQMARISCWRFGIFERCKTIKHSRTASSLWGEPMDSTTECSNIHIQISKWSILRIDHYLHSRAMEYWARSLDVNFLQSKQLDKDTSTLVLQMEGFISMISSQVTQQWRFLGKADPPEKMQLAITTGEEHETVRLLETSLGILTTQYSLRLPSMPPWRFGPCKLWRNALLSDQSWRLGKRIQKRHQRPK